MSTAVNPINGERRSPLGPASGIHVGRQLVVHDLGRFDLTSTTATGYKKFVPNYRGRVIGFFAEVDTVTTDTNADATLIPRIGGTNITGGLITLADVNDGTNPVATANKIFQTTLITADNTFDEDDDIDVLWTVTNAFGDGVVRLYVICEAYTG